jgi:hypothetical protein
MSNQRPAAARGIRRRGLDATFEADEARKSNLILEGRALREQGQDEAAASRFAQAAAIEEQLADRCGRAGLVEKEFVHRFSAASCWAQAGDFYHAITLCNDLLARADLPDRLRQRVLDYADALRARRAQWYAGLLLEAAGVEG